MSTFVTVIHIFACALLVLLVLIQSGKGAEISASLGGSSQTVFGSSGGANFFTNLTSALAGIFMITSLVLTAMGGASKKSVFDSATPGAPAPAAPASSAPAGAANAVPAGQPAAPQSSAPAAK